MQIHLKNVKAYAIPTTDVVGSVMILFLWSACSSRIVQPWMRVVKLVSAVVLSAKLKQVLFNNSQIDSATVLKKLTFNLLKKTMSLIFGLSSIILMFKIRLSLL